MCIEEVAKGSDALLVAFNGGMFGGNAVAQVLFGNVNPSGKLSISFPRHSGQLPVYYNSLPGWHGEKYMDIEKTPLYAFGQGISYTTFSYSNLIIFEDKKISVDVRNTGDVDGLEIIQVYYNDVVSSVMTPEKQLINFKKVFIPAGEMKTVVFELKEEDLSLVNKDEQRVTEPGEFEIMVGASSLDQDLLKAKIVIM